jgi:hypothetical protein
MWGIWSTTGCGKAPFSRGETRLRAVTLQKPPERQPFLGKSRHLGRVTLPKTISCYLTMTFRSKPPRRMRQAGARHTRVKRIRPADLARIDNSSSQGLGGK